MTSSSAYYTLQSICHANRRILGQKLELLERLDKKHGPIQSAVLYQMPCSIVGASMGQHLRHSINHLELAVNVAVDHVHTWRSKTKIHSHPVTAETKYTRPEDPLDVLSENEYPVLQYDVRIRGCELEKNIQHAKARIVSLEQSLDQILRMQRSEPDDGNKVQSLLNSPVKAAFSLLSDTKQELEVSTFSTIARELSFAAHHAIHHMALIKIIATRTAGFNELEDLPSDFGKAPSTVLFEQKNTDS